MIRWIFPNIHVSKSLTMPATTLLDIPPQEQEQMLAALRRARYGYIGYSRDTCQNRTQGCDLHQKASHRSSANAHPSSNFGPTEPLGEQCLHCWGLLRRRPWSPQDSPGRTGLSQPSFDPFTDDLPLELRKHRQHPSHGPPGRRGQIQRFSQRDEAHTELMQSLERDNQVGQRSSPPVKPPDHYH
jgi:hypothetical protein